jgi:hypothetical protein
MEDFETILKRKIAYYGETHAAYEFAAEEYANKLFEDKMQDMYFKGYQSAINTLQSSYEALLRKTPEIKMSEKQKEQKV